MDTGDEDKFELERRNNDLMSYPSENMSSELRNGTSDFDHTFMGSVPIGSSMEVSKGDFIGSLPCSSASVINSFVPGTWDHQSFSLQDMNCSGSNIQNYASSSNTMGVRKAGFGSFGSGIDGLLDMGSNSFSSMLKDGPLLPNVAGMFLQNSTQLPADSGLIERAARFSCFNRGNFSDMMDPLVESMGVYSRNAESMKRAQGVFAGNCSESLSGGRSCKNDLEVDGARNAFTPEKQVAMDGSPIKANRKGDLSPHDGTKLGDSLCGNESAEGRSSSAGQGDHSLLEGAFRESSSKELGSKKRKRNSQDSKYDKTKEVETAKFSAENHKKVEQNSTSTSNRTIGKQVNEGPQTSESPKGEYIHVRARRGQATNSHSLAERVRRERISERMKFLQDLVPGCNKVTGKAVMLDEIINYVQSLQRQVEFLSMKLATVNPRLDFSAEGFLAHDILHPHAGPSYPLGFYPEMPIPCLPGHPTQPGLQGIGSSSDLFRRINPSLTPMTGGLKKSTQLPHIWEDELHNVIQTGYGSSDLPSDQEEHGTMPPVRTKTEM